MQLLYKPNTPDDRDIDYFERRLNEIRIPVDRVDADSREGAALTELYDAMDRPAVLVTNDEGVLVQMWQGSLPAVSEVSAAYGAAL